MDEELKARLSRAVENLVKVANSRNEAVRGASRASSKAYQKVSG